MDHSNINPNVWEEYKKFFENLPQQPNIYNSPPSYRPYPVPYYYPQHPCPSCGRCPQCGRGGWPVTPPLSW